MPDSPNKLSQFWQELKRRKVLRSLAIYAGTAFIILEASSIIFPLWNFPEWSINLVLWLLVLGAFISVIIAWIYDITPGGLRRTKPMEELTPEERIPDSRGWKAATYISLVVIVGLIVLNIVGGGKQLRAGDIQSLVILPFENFTGDDQLENMVFSMHSLLIGDMGRISGLRVIGKTSSKIYKDTDLSAKDIARECNVDAVLEPTIMCLGDSVCMQFRLISTTGEEDQIWVGDYREDKRQILNLFNRLTRQVADEVMIELTPEEERLLSISKTVDREAYDEYLKALSLVDFSRESLYKALEYLNNAVEREPDWAPIYAGLVDVWMYIQQMGLESPSITSSNIYTNLNKALELDPNLSYSHNLSAMIAYLMEWNWEKSEKEFLKALAINPSDAGSRIFYTHLLCILQRHDEAIPQAQLALELDPLNPNMKIWYSVVLMAVDDFKSALELGEEVAAADPNYIMAYSVIESAAFYCRDYNKVMEATKYLWAEEVDFKEVERIFEESGFVAANEEILRQWEELAKKGYFSPVAIAHRHMMVDQPDKAMEWFEKGFEVRDPVMPYIATHGFLCEPLFDNPRFIEIIQKMNLPLPED